MLKSVSLPSGNFSLALERAGLQNNVDKPTREAFRKNLLSHEQLNKDSADKCMTIIDHKDTRAYQKKDDSVNLLAVRPTPSYSLVKTCAVPFFFENN